MVSIILSLAHLPKERFVLHSVLQLEGRLYIGIAPERRILIPGYSFICRTGTCPNSIYSS
ncbi:MAG: hypothetical protein ABR986_05995 [Methanomassiliicoccales archaeon]